MTNLIGRDPRPLQKVFKNTSECFIQMFNNYACVETIKGEQNSQIPGIYDALYMFFFFAILSSFMEKKKPRQYFNIRKLRCCVGGRV